MDFNLILLVVVAVVAFGCLALCFVPLDGAAEKYTVQRNGGKIFTPRPEPLLRVENVRIQYGSTIVLNDVSLEILPGEKIAVIGKSGCGKTSLLSCLRVELRPNSGKIAFGTNTTQYGNADFLTALRQHIPFIDQAASTLLPYFTVQENVEESLIITNNTQVSVNGYLQIVGLSGKADSYPAQLSGGEKQRAVIAAALAMNGKILLADEPTSALDQPIAKDVLRILRELSCAVVLVSHQPGLAAEFCDRLLLVHNGQLFDITNLKDSRLLFTFGSYDELITRSEELSAEQKRREAEEAARLEETEALQAESYRKHRFTVRQKEQLPIPYSSKRNVIPLSGSCVPVERPVINKTEPQFTAGTELTAKTNSKMKTSRFAVTTQE